MGFIAKVSSTFVEILARFLGHEAHGSRDAVIFLSLILGATALFLLTRLFALVNETLVRSREFFQEKSRIDDLKLKVGDLSSKLNTELTNVSKQAQKNSRKLSLLEDKISKEPVRLELDDGSDSVESRIALLEQKLGIVREQKLELEVQTPATDAEVPASSPAEPAKAEPETSPLLLALSRTRQKIHAQLLGILQRKKVHGLGFHERIREVLDEHGLAGCWNKTLVAALDAVPDDPIEPLSELGTRIENLLAEAIDERLKAETEAEILPKTKSQRPRVVLLLGARQSERLEVAADLAMFLKKQGAKVILADCNVCDSRQREKLFIWGEKAGVPVLAGSERNRAGAVAYKSIHKAQDEHFDVLVMHAPDPHSEGAEEEWTNLCSIIEREHPGAPHERLLIDNVGDERSIGMSLPKEITATGLIFTGFDLTEYGGLLVSRAEEFKLPVRFVVLREPKRRIHPFSPKEFAAALCLGVIPDTSAPASNTAPSV